MSADPEKAVPRRATRFDLVLPVRFRSAGGGEWSGGVSVDVSRTGLLFAPEGDPVPVGERLEFRIRFPAHRALRGGEARCTGRVVRTVPPPAGGEHDLVAVSIERYVLAPDSQLPTATRSTGARTGEGKS